MPHVRNAGQPGLDLGVEVERGHEAAPGQERGLEVAVAALDQALGLRVPSRSELDPHPECPGERRGLHRWTAAPADRGLAVPQQVARAAAPAADDLPHPGQDVPGLARGDHHRVGHPRVPTRHRQHRQHPRSATGHGDRRGREPQIALGHLARAVLDAIGGVRWHEQRTQLTDPVLEDRQRPGPANPLGDHRGGHPRILGQQGPDLRLDRVHQRPTRPPLPRGRSVRPQRRPHRVACQPQPAGDLLDRHALRAVQTTNLSPLFQRDHPPRLTGGVSPNPSLGGQSQRAVDSPVINDGAAAMNELFPRDDRYSTRYSREPTRSKRPGLER